MRRARHGRMLFTKAVTEWPKDADQARPVRAGGLVGDHPSVAGLGSVSAHR
jgi:hypothetical protein